MRCVHAALREGRQFVFEMGGHGNNRLIHEALAEAFQAHGYEYENPFYFPPIAEYSSMLEGTGFEVRYAILFGRPAPLKGKDGLRDWITMFLKEPLAVIRTEDQKSVLDQAVNSLKTKLCRDDGWHADYVRLRMKAIKVKE